MLQFEIIAGNTGGAVTTCKNHPYIEAFTGFFGIDILFTKGVYLLQGDIRDGGWALSYFISQKSRKEFFDNNIEDEDRLIIKIDNIESDISELRKHSFYVGCNSKKEYSLNRPLKVLLKKAIKKSRNNKSVEEIIEIFHLTRYNNKYNHGIETLQSRAALGFALQKKVFCFPWIDANYLEPQMYYVYNTIHTLAKHDKIVIIPTNIPEAFTGLYNKTYDIRKKINYDLKDEIIDFLNHDRKHVKIEKEGG